MVAMTGDATAARQLTPDSFSVRTRVHEYGGAPMSSLEKRFIFSNFTDQLLYAMLLARRPSPDAERLSLTRTRRPRRAAG